MHFLFFNRLGEGGEEGEILLSLILLPLLLPPLSLLLLLPLPLLSPLLFNSGTTRGQSDRSPSEPSQPSCSSVTASTRNGADADAGADAGADACADAGVGVGADADADANDDGDVPSLNQCFASSASILSFHTRYSSGIVHKESLPLE